MKGKIVAILCLLMLSSTILALTHPVKAPDGSPYGWVEPAYVGYDPYYDEYITGYLEGTYWNLTMSWTNWGWWAINVSAIRLYFDWGKNYSYGFATPIQIMPGNTQTFTVYNVTPSIKEAPELWTHYYDIWIDHVNNTSPPYRQLDPIYFSWGYNFVALSADHLACLNYWSKYWMFIEGGRGPLIIEGEGIPLIIQAQMIPTMTPFYTNITEVQVLLTKAMFEFSQGVQIYQAGVFSAARAHLEAGDTLINDALTVWNDRGTEIEDANLASQNAQANYYNALGEASKTNAYGWVLFGLGWVFIGLGIVIYSARKPKAVQS